MTDIRRTLLWVVFTMSLVLLWDAWNKHTGQPSIFGPNGARPAASASPALPASQIGVPTPAMTALPAPAGTVGSMITAAPRAPAVRPAS